LTFCQDLALICVPMNSGSGQMRGKGVAMVAKAGTGVGKQQE
jgi:hypothetical protein